ncbi:MAG: hypothetical protein C0612_12740 [Desulfobulbaceae bacterium]|jgi:hypothetical protein|nr:MAG: hypothetical protein C0612_12740 [Desulfobulbaceae bacterium]
MEKDSLFFSIFLWLQMGRGLQFSVIKDEKLLYLSTNLKGECAGRKSILWQERYTFGKIKIIYFLFILSR